MTVAEVKMWGHLVGAVAWDENANLAVFEFTRSFKSLQWDIAPFTLPISSTQYIFRFPELRRKNTPELDTFKGLPGLLADALPDRYGNELMNMWLAQNGRPINSMNPVEMLCFMGNRGMGALEFEPGALVENKKSRRLEIESLVEMADRLLNQKQSFRTNLQEGEEQALAEILRIGTSAGGARPKAVVAYHEKTGEVRSGQALAPKGFEHWLIKLDGVRDIQLGDSHDYGRVEMAYYQMAIDCGIEMMPCRLLEENGRAHFMTKRFDREDGDIKHHIQTFCALKHFDYNLIEHYSYEQLFQTMRELQLPYPSAEQMYRRMVFNVLAKNCDDHTKNFSFRLKQGGQWELAPAYDICHAYQPQHRWVSQHALSVNGKRQQIISDDLIQVGNTIRTQKMKPKEIIQEISEIIRGWKKYADQYGVPAKLRDAIAETHQFA